MSDQKLSRQPGVISSPYPSSPQAAGMIVAFAGSSAPSGWALCDGAELSTASYPQLSARIGTTWNLCTNPLTGIPWGAPAGGNFRLPDLRGTFLRGVGDFTDNTKDTTLGGFKAHKTAVGGMSASGGVASLTGTQTFATSVQNETGHTHGTSSLSADIAFSSDYTYANQVAGGTFTSTKRIPATGANQANATSIPESTNIQGTTDGGSSHGHTANTASVGISQTSLALSSTDTETIPQNVGINYLIKLYDDAGSIVMSGSPFIGSEFRPSPIAIAGNNSLLLDKFYTINDVGNTTQTLPTATGSNGVITVENTGAGMVTIDGSGSETINGITNQNIGQYASIKVRDYAAGKWIIMH